MAKFHGPIGFVTTEETSPGVYTEKVVEREYYGDVLRNYKRYENTSNYNPDITISNEISIVADPYAFETFFAMRYVKWMGTAWTISSVDAAEYPRLKLSIGGVYNGKQA